MTGRWPGVLSLCAAVFLALAGVSGAPTLTNAAPWLTPASARLDRSLPVMGPVMVAEKSKQAQGYVWSATRLDSSIRLRGAVPSGKDRRTVLGMVKAHFPDLEVDDRLKVTRGGPPQDRWLGAVSFALKQLSHLKRGSARLSNFTLKVNGEALSATDYAEIAKALAGPLPAGVTVGRQTVKPPVADPFTFVADLGANTLSLSGSVPSEDARKQLRELSRQLFRRPGLKDQLELASGAPQGWDEAVVAALRALSGLDSGKVALAGLAVTIEGVAPDEGTAVAVSYQLRRDLPALFSTSESITWKQASTSRDIAGRMPPRVTEANGLWPLVPLSDLLSPVE
jgi:hypothetical protein